MLGYVEKFSQGEFVGNLSANLVTTAWCTFADSSNLILLKERSIQSMGLALAPFPLCRNYWLYSYNTPNLIWFLLVNVEGMRKRYVNMECLCSIYFTTSKKIILK